MSTPKMIETDDPDRWLVWWTTGVEASLARVLVDSGLVPVPEWLHREIRSRHGRAGRCRLWRRDGLSLPPMHWPEPGSIASHPIARWLDEQSAGGIVVHRCQRDLVRRLPGLVTDWRLRLA